MLSSEATCQESGLRKQVERDLATAQSDNKELLKVGCAVKQQSVLLAVANIVQMGPHMYDVVCSKAQEREREEASARLQQIDRQHSAANKALTQNLDEAREQLIRRCVIPAWSLFYNVLRPCTYAYGHQLSRHIPLVLQSTNHLCHGGVHSTAVGAVNLSTERISGESAAC